MYRGGVVVDRSREPSHNIWIEQWAHAQRTQHGLQTLSDSKLFSEQASNGELSEIAEQAKKRAEVARIRELHTLKGHVESVVKIKGLDIDTIQQAYTL